MHDWILLIYSLPSQPSRKRAYVWRELKKFGAVYLRDGVAVLPRRPDLEQHLQDVAQRIEEYEGEVDLLLSPGLARRREAELVARFREERAAEYKELYHACVRFLRDVLEEVDADDFGFPDVDNLESELGRLHRWHEQITDRDYFGGEGADRVEEILVKCDRAFDNFVKTASEREDTELDPETGSRRTETQPDREDVFERLSGARAETADDAHPL